MENKILRIAAVVGALGTIGFGINWFGGISFANKEKNEIDHQEIKKEAQIDRTKVELIQKDVTYIKEGITEIKEKIK